MEILIAYAAYLEGEKSNYFKSGTKNILSCINQESFGYLSFGTVTSQHRDQPRPRCRVMKPVLAVTCGNWTAPFRRSFSKSVYPFNSYSCNYSVFKNTGLGFPMRTSAFNLRTSGSLEEVYFLSVIIGTVSNYLKDKI